MLMDDIRKHQFDRFEKSCKSAGGIIKTGDAEERTCVVDNVKIKYGLYGPMSNSSTFGVIAVKAPKSDYWVSWVIGTENVDVQL